MRPRGSLLAKVFLVHATVLCLAAVILPLVINAMLQERALSFERQVLTDRARLIGEALTAAPDGSLKLSPGRYSREGERGEFGYAVVDEAGAVQLASSPLAERILGALGRAESAGFSAQQAGGRHYKTVSFPVSVEDKPYWIMLGWNVGVQGVIHDDVLHNFLRNALAVTVPLLGLLLLLDALVVRHYFRPVLRVSRQVRALDPVPAETRLVAADLPAEIRPLAEAFNVALQRLEQSSRLQKEFTADAAHELRTPLAVLDARVQTLPPSDLRNALVADARLMARIVSQLLEMAKLEEAGEAGGRANVLEVGRSVVAALAPEAIRKGQTLSLIEPDGVSTLQVVAREQDLWHMLRNLVENAIRHTPAGTTIDVVVAADGSLIVRDNGPGIPEELHEHIFKRFWRRQRRGGSGAGLGMAIAQRVAQANGGSITLQSEDGRGTVFVVRLPLAPDTGKQPQSS